MIKTKNSINFSLSTSPALKKHYYKTLCYVGLRPSVLFLAKEWSAVRSSEVYEEWKSGSRFVFTK